MQNESEEIVSSWWADRGVTAERYSKQERRIRKTPDFRLRRDEHLLGLCEVKFLSKDTWLDDQLATSEHGVIVGG